jgi:hypothetical protein
VKHTTTRFVSLVFALAILALPAAFAAPTDAVRITTQEALSTLEYALPAPANVADVVRDGRGLRFIGWGGKDVLRVGAPSVIDAEGKPSNRAWWEVSGSSMRLRVDDELLVYPLTIQPQGSATKPRPRFQARTEAHGGSISGTLTDAVTGDPVPSQLVHAYDAAGQYVASAISGERGVYTYDDLAPGTYYIVAIPYEYETQLYNGFSCPNKSCSITSGTPVAVTQGSSATNIDFALQSFAARISGQVTDARTSTPLEGVLVNFYDAAGNRAGTAFSDANGDYTVSLNGGGTYYARTQNLSHEGYIDELYDGTPCTGCDVMTGTGITATVRGVTTGIDFSLDPDGGSISGTVTDGSSGAPLRFENVYILAANGQTVTYGQTDENGRYTTFNGLATGNYYAYVQPGGYDAEIYNGVPCPGGVCTPAGATPIAVTAGSDTSAIDFALGSSQARISGTVTDAGSHAPLGYVEVGVYNDDGERVASGTTDEATGAYDVAVPAAGDYYVRTFASLTYPAYVDELWEDIPCNSCFVTSGTPVTTTAGQVTSGIDFALTGGGSITGTLTEEGNGNPIVGAPVLIYDASGNLATYATTTSTGHYTSIHALSTGTYYVVATPFGYARELYNNIPCPDDETCIVTNGTPVSVTFGVETANVNFALASQIARVSGYVLDEGTNNGIAADVYFYDSIGNVVTVASTNPATGAYSVNVGATGNYYARTFNYSGTFTDELFDNISCPAGCNPVTGTPISATVGSTTPNVNFLLAAVGCGAIIVDPDTLPGGNEGSSYSKLISATGGSGSYLFSVTGGALPGGLTLNASTGALTGTLTPAGTHVFEITAIDTSTNCRGFRDYTIDVIPGPPTFTSLSPTTGPTSGGQTVTLTGSSLATTSEVTFGVEAATFVSVSDTQVVVKTPPHAAGSVDVTIATSGGTAIRAAAYTYVQSPSITLTTSPNPSVYTHSVTLSVTLDNPAATGTVTYYDGETTVIGTSTISGGSSSFSTSTLASGTHDLTAVFTSNGILGTATSNTVVQVVNRSPRNITLTSLDNPSTWGDNVTFVATLSPSGAEATTVTFYNGATALGTANVAGNQATLTTGGFEPGTYSITASTAATVNFFAGTSNVLQQVVNKAPRTIAVSTAPSPSTYPEAVTITASLSPADEALTVAFYDGATLLGTVAVDSAGNAVLTIATGAWNAGTHPITATTAETLHYLASTSPVHNHVVQKATPIFTDLTSPTIIVGTATVTVSGNLAAGTLIPPGVVTITMNGVPTIATLDANGGFSATLATAALPVGAYPISFSYAGSTNFSAATATSVLNVTYGIQLVQYTPTKNAGSTFPTRIKLLNAAGVNVSNATIDVTLVGYKLATAATYTPLTGIFAFQNAQGGSYFYTWNTHGLAPGNYLLAYRVENDPVVHTIAFTLSGN